MQHATVCCKLEPLMRCICPLDNWISPLVSYRQYCRTTLSEKTRTSNHLQMSLQSQIFLRSNFKTLSVGWPGVWTCDLRSADRRFPKWAKQAVVKNEGGTNIIRCLVVKNYFQLNSSNTECKVYQCLYYWTLVLSPLGSICPFHRGELFVWGVQRVWNHCWSYSPLRPSSLASDTCWADSSSFVALIPLSIRRNFQSYARTENCQARRWKQINSGTSNYPKCISKTTGEQGTNYLHRIMMLERKKKKLTSDWRQTANKNTEIDKRIVLQVAVSCMWSTLHPWKG